MTKIAIFVEGQTERKFVKQLIYQRYGSVPTVIVREMVLKGKGSYFQPIDVNQGQGIGCLFLVVEVPEYSKVLTMAIYNAENMVRNIGFALIVGLRDLIPNKRNEKAEVINLISRLLSGIAVRDKISIILAVMETEAWFLYDWQLFQRIDCRLSPSYIQSNLNIDLVNDDPELKYEHPSKTMDEIFRLVGLRYRKREGEIDTVVKSIDFNHMFSFSDKIDSFRRFISKLDYCGLPHQ